MAYKTKDLFEKAQKVAKEKKCFFIEQLVSFMPCDKTTFYKHMPIDSNENNAIKEILEENKIEVKSAMYNKWFKSDAPALQIGLMKLIATDEEAHRLNGSKTQNDLTTNGKEISTTTIINLGDGKKPEK